MSCPDFSTLQTKSFDEALTDVAARFVAVEYVGPLVKTASFGDWLSKTTGDVKNWVSTAADKAQTWYGAQDQGVQRALAGAGIGLIGGGLAGGLASAVSGRPRPIRNALLYGLLGGGVGAGAGYAYHQMDAAQKANDKAKAQVEMGKSEKALKDIPTDPGQQIVSGVGKLVGGELPNALPTTLNPLKAEFFPGHVPGLVGANPSAGIGSAIGFGLAHKFSDKPVPLFAGVDSKGGPTAKFVNEKEVQQVLGQPVHAGKGVTGNPNAVITERDFSDPGVFKVVGPGGKLDKLEGRFIRTGNVDPSLAVNEAVRRPIKGRVKGTIFGGGVGTLVNFLGAMKNKGQVTPDAQAQAVKTHIENTVKANPHSWIPELGSALGIPQPAGWDPAAVNPQDRQTLLDYLSRLATLQGRQKGANLNDATFSDAALGGTTPASKRRRGLMAGTALAGMGLSAIPGLDAFGGSAPKALAASPVFEAKPTSTQPVSATLDSSYAPVTSAPIAGAFEKLHVKPVADATALVQHYDDKIKNLRRIQHTYDEWQPPPPSTLVNEDRVPARLVGAGLGGTVGGAAGLMLGQRAVNTPEFNRGRSSVTRRSTPLVSLLRSITGKNIRTISPPILRMGGLAGGVAAGSSVGVMGGTVGHDLTHEAPNDIKMRAYNLSRADKKLELGKLDTDIVEAQKQQIRPLIHLQLLDNRFNVRPQKVAPSAVPAPAPAEKKGADEKSTYDAILEAAKKYWNKVPTSALVGLGSGAALGAALAPSGKRRKGLLLGGLGGTLAGLGVDQGIKAWGGTSTTAPEPKETATKPEEKEAPKQPKTPVQKPPTPSAALNPAAVPAVDSAEWHTIKEITGPAAAGAVSATGTVAAIMAAVHRIRNKNNALIRKATAVGQNLPKKVVPKAAPTPKAPSGTPVNSPGMSVTGTAVQPGPLVLPPSFSFPPLQGP